MGDAMGREYFEEAYKILAKPGLRADYDTEYKKLVEAGDDRIMRSKCTGACPHRSAHPQWLLSAESRFRAKIEHETSNYAISKSQMIPALDNVIPLSQDKMLEADETALEDSRMRRQFYHMILALILHWKATWPWTEPLKASAPFPEEN
ncbi:Uu.00g085350.m01.CDS01 [Anthostomella pinea]|uniref:Uu.00g085350.m01.CDS01 n=1 Tax=Anthostomella pinea TaxID=933095 RepID=A0AAI8YHD8_9PEZI|nr:Uu.00g085350.m01.CDS01 [Anthostomella pinea]